jgi:hypothetical protein
MKLPQKVNIELESIVYIKFQWASQWENMRSDTEGRLDCRFYAFNFPDHYAVAAFFLGLVHGLIGQIDYLAGGFIF